MITIKLTRTEALDLVDALVDLVGAERLAPVIFAALPFDKATELTVNRNAVALTKAETAALVKAVVPLIPGATLKAKIAAVLKAARPCFSTAERFKEVTAYVVDRLKAYAAGDSIPVAPAGDGFLRFYGRVNLWCAAGEDELKKDISVCAKHGVGYTIEMAGWRSGETAFDSASNLSNTVNLYGKLVEWCKAAKIPLLVSITNWNVTQTKYGNKGRPFASIVPTAKKLAETVLACGGQDLVYVQPVAETGNDADAKAFEKWCGALFAGWKLVYNGGSRPSKPAYGWPHFAYHPNTVADGGKAGGISVSDTGTIIKQLAADGTLDGPGDPAKIAAWFAKCKAAGAIGAGYYAFLREKHDAAAIRACAAPAAVAQPVESGEDVDLSKAVWHGPDGRGCAVTETVSGLTFDGKAFRYSPSKGTEAWEPHSGEKNCNQYACFFVKRNGVWAGGKFDWSTYSRKSRDRKNIDGGYTGGIVPKAGEEVRFCLTDLNMKRRTNAPGVKWK
jgi:hypothetical protein